MASTSVGARNTWWAIRIAPSSMLSYSPLHQLWVSVGVDNLIGITLMARVTKVLLKSPRSKVQGPRSKGDLRSPTSCAVTVHHQLPDGHWGPETAPGVLDHLLRCSSLPSQLSGSLFCLLSPREGGRR